MENQKRQAIDAVDDFRTEFSKSILDVQQSIAKEIKALSGDEKSETERIKPIFGDVFGKAVSKHKKSGGAFADVISKELKKALSQGVTLKDFQLSRLIYTSGLAAGYLFDSDLEEAFKCLSLANRLLGEYKNNDELYEYFNTPINKKPQENFKRDTLLKLIFGMANNGYNCNHDNIKNRAVQIKTKLHKNGIQINDEDIILYLREAYNLETQWKESHANSGTVTESEQNIMLKLIIGMAIDKYGYDPSSKSNKATGDNVNGISAKIQCHVYVDNNVIRNCLNYAKKII